MKLAALRWLIADTFRQSLWSGVFWLTLGVNVVTILFCLTLGMTGLAATEADTRRVLFWTGGCGANTLGILLAIIFTAGFIPSFLDPNAAMILLAKPTPRWLMLAGRSLGVFCFVGFHATVFVVGTWLATGLSTGYFPIQYLEVLPVLLLNYTAFQAFAILLAVMTRNLVAAVVGTLVFWSLCAMMNFGRHALVAYDLEHFSAVSRFLSEAIYWLFPKPADMIAVLYNAIQPEPLGARLEDFGKIQDKGAFHPVLSMAASLLFPVLALGMAGYELETAEY